jgi:hypothetical protein
MDSVQERVNQVADLKGGEMHEMRGALLTMEARLALDGVDSRILPSVRIL